jgi:hypothetical protein
MPVIAAQCNHTHPTAEQVSTRSPESLQLHTIQRMSIRLHGFSQDYELKQRKAESCPSLIEAATQQMLEAQ